MTKVLLGQSYYLHFDPKELEAMKPYPPLGTLYAASYIRGRGYDVALFDAMLASSEQEWVEALEQHSPEFQGVLPANVDPEQDCYQFGISQSMCATREKSFARSFIFGPGYNAFRLFLNCPMLLAVRGQVQLHA